ncbi:cupin [Bacillus coahuilensis m2-6]|uniref:cupin domain-containing protein n=1 Tax=Bacillus coahuilensis TaxID=408580 RepID=UPI000185090A|nr:cupin domain-containing protein [Bacillus coahuilensis]KUP04856.1 cupin [Bacillus coahuilensis m2-6]
MYNTAGNGSYPYHSVGYQVNEAYSWEQVEQPLEALQHAIHHEMTCVDRYYRLSTVAPNTQHQQQLVYLVETKKAQLKQFTDLYIALTGTEPQYYRYQTPFTSYGEGLEQAYQSEVYGYHYYNRSSTTSTHPTVQYIFQAAASGEMEHIARVDWLRAEVSNGSSDFGGKPFVFNIDEATTSNDTYRTAVWTGEHLQVTLMSIDVGDDIGLEVHPTTDQFLRIEEGQGLVQMGPTQDNLNFEEMAFDDYAILIPAGTWHNVTNTGDIPMKLYAIYAPPEHPFGTVHKTKAEAMEAERNPYYG